MEPKKFYRKKDIQAVSLFYDMVQQQFHLPPSIARDVVEKLWPVCPERQLFIDVAREKKALITSQGWAYRTTTWLTLTAETEDWILEMDPRLRIPNNLGGAA